MISSTISTPKFPEQRHKNIPHRITVARMLRSVDYIKESIMFSDQEIILSVDKSILFDVLAYIRTCEDQLIRQSDLEPRERGSIPEEGD